jgi:hypothetical protein
MHVINLRGIFLKTPKIIVVIPARNEKDHITKKSNCSR